MRLARTVQTESWYDRAVTLSTRRGNPIRERGDHAVGVCDAGRRSKSRSREPDQVVGASRLYRFSELKSERL